MKARVLFGVVGFAFVLLALYVLPPVVLAAALIVWKLTVGRRRYRYGRSVPRRRGGGYRGRRRH